MELDLSLDQVYIYIALLNKFQEVSKCIKSLRAFLVHSIKREIRLGIGPLLCDSAYVTDVTAMCKL